MLEGSVKKMKISGISGADQNYFELIKNTEEVYDRELDESNDNEVIIMLNVTDFEAMETFMTSPEITQWNEENNNVDILYSIERMD